MRVALILLFLASTSNVFADSLVLGRVKNSRATGVSACADEPKAPDEVAGICMHTWFRWTIDVERTIGGKKLSGRVFTARVQHAEMLRTYQEQMRLFALQPIEDLELKKKLHADYYLLDMSPVMYCMSQNPKAFGLAEASHVQGAGDEKEYCFDLHTKNEK